MAKSFKQLLTQRVVPMPTAGRDFLDLLNEPAGTPVGGASSVPEPGEVVVPGNSGLPAPGGQAGKPGNTAQPGKRSPKTRSTDTPCVAGSTTGSSSADDKHVTEDRSALPPVVAQPPEAGDARQTFVVRRHLLEQMRDYVHARRAKGDYAYSQKQALEEALTEFLTAREPAQPRPPEAREREQQFQTRVREGRQRSAATVESSARPTAQKPPESDASQVTERDRPLRTGRLG
jgi:hypothetical protein